MSLVSLFLDILFIGIVMIVHGIAVFDCLLACL